MSVETRVERSNRTQNTALHYNVLSNIDSLLLEHLKL